MVAARRLRRRLLWVGVVAFWMMVVVALAARAVYNGVGP